MGALPMMEGRPTRTKQIRREAAHRKLNGIFAEETEMKGVYATVISVAALAMSVGTAAAECGVESGSVRILTNDFEALQIVTSEARKCSGGAVTVTVNQTTEHKNLQVPALKTNPAEYTVAVVANGSIVPLLNEGLVRPLDDLVEKYGQDLQPGQLIKIDGKVMAIAFMANAQHLIYRADILEKAGLQPPTTYEEIVEAAKVIEEKGIMKDPLGANFKPGWDLAQEFVNMYIGYGGEFFEPESAAPAINNEKGVAALNMMKSLADYMNRDFMTFNTNELKALWEADRVAIMNQWGSRAGAIIDQNGPAPKIAAVTELAAAPSVGGNEFPATTLWWDGFTIAKNVSDEDAEASFRAMLHGIRPEVATQNPSAAAWLMKGYEPAPGVVGVMKTAAAKAKPYPMLPYMGLMHTALGAELVEFMQGSESAEEALADAEAAYIAAAKEGGFLN
jgi:multiple sugar transport system substrate-binding protein